MREKTPAYSYRLFWSDEDDCYVAVCPEFPHLSGLGASAEEALAELSVAIEMAIESMQADGSDAPVPSSLPCYSGQFRLRITRTLHAQLAARAEMEGVSLNALLVEMLSRGIAAFGPSATKRANGIKRHRRAVVR